MKYLNISQVIKLHTQIIAVSGGLDGYNKTQISYLNSVCENIKNDEYYPTFLDKLTHLIFSCVKFHPFLDANKRTALHIGLALILINFPDLKIDDYYIKMEDIVINVADGSVSKDKLKEELNKILKDKR
ncbi:type II toxin-antitoxin system death-on-curing family toxin [Campylobacter ureolyticus]|uniref:Death-on-curing family protein n=1 Tax=Campylobacter ureolyticus TaxID=827 RepID=S5U298_9BACT|nr:type II toxin-antitoxin system death-on-curing family toxin [Campylobacter ureolyticus]AGS56909.1 death-on-curing family protein [Campylobacter ureolyticus DSM 20703]MCR8685058.1 type II toxin-antitoxin system death-on-curing family toxin [Campylobacter ureolyticus]QKF84951.1 Fic domain-containing protein [Campylobacter ureolyticus]QQY34884.1 type II toxin-antitoxin system death-on-curing family toxin [Campylobacter ureolyticus]SUX20439.1 death-on-curing family protein [Campylobacter ureoly